MDNFCSMFLSFYSLHSHYFGRHATVLVSRLLSLVNKKVLRDVINASGVTGRFCSEGYPSENTWGGGGERLDLSLGCKVDIWVMF